MANRVLMVPHLSNFDKPHSESGIKRVVEAYTRLLPAYGFRMVAPDQPYDLLAVHAGMQTTYKPDVPLVAHCHGLYWTADYPADTWEWHANGDVITSILYAREITVPSEWVAETFKRDMHLSPHVIPHGINWAEWANHSQPNEEYILYNKNRSGDVCDPNDIAALAGQFTGMRFVTTFAPDRKYPNITAIGVVSNARMKLMVQGAGVYLSTTKETFGIGVLEALAAGVPVLGYNHGGNKITVRHGVNGYLARPGDVDDLAEGLHYCVKHRKILSDNARESAKAFTWEAAAEKVAAVYRQALQEDYRPYKR